MSLDFIETSEGLVMIECNPRPTDGVLLMEPEELERGLLSPGEEMVIVPAGRQAQLDFAVFAQIFKERVVRRGYSSGAWGWQTAYRETIAS